ncbi:hypothetical protein QBC46DRAFT_416412 [Diplogelasinospora grovesii]|uniref:Uncharacterized protein n=1 Tax=Diplogelasinospora grovesii TaxID=303347 RepID=A0AAN6N1A1_9PEZI|nr:hypothetical protein QBC46DRAFT_416412 [Diplogelasinospora grovesii]
MATEPAAEPFSVKGKTAIVTGAGSGINLAFADLLLSNGCNVVFADLALRPEAQSLLARYANSPDASPQAFFVPTDVRSWDALTKLFDMTVYTFGGFDILCPGAGVYEPHWSNFWHPPDSSPEARDTLSDSRYATLDINLTHPVRATQMALSYWLHPRPASTPSPTAPSPKRIVHISSVAAQLPLFSNPIYGASKAAISAFVRSMAPLDSEVNVRVNAVAPGVIRTPLWTDHPEKLAYVDEEHDSWATPEEVAEAMLRCLEDPDLEGGTILEVGRQHTRVVQQLNDPGPDRDPKRGLCTSNGKVGYDDALRLLREDGWGVPKPI